MATTPVSHARHGRRECEGEVVSYIRVSTNSQAESGLGLPIQRDQIRAYCQREKIILAREYEDAGISGSDIQNRPGLLRLLEDAKTGQIKRVIIAKLDRIARDTFATLFIEKELKKFGAELFSIAEPYRWEDPAQRIFLQLISSFAEFEKSRIVERLRAGRIKTVQAGRFPGGRSPLGYKLRAKKLMLDEREAEIVRKIFKLRMGRHSLREIARRLNAEGVPSKTGAKFYGSTIRYILKSSTYRSLFTYCGKSYRGIHPEIRP